MNVKGFTLIELLATIVVMGLLMVISLPNVNSIVDKNKRTSYINDARKMVILAKYKFGGDTNAKPDSTICKKYKITELDISELNNTPNNGKYDFSSGNYSYVTIKYNSSKKTYDYVVQLVEEFKVNNKTYYRGLKYTESSLLYKDNAKILYVTDTFDSLSSTIFQTSTNRSC